MAYLRSKKVAKSTSSTSTKTGTNANPKIRVEPIVYDDEAMESYKRIDRVFRPLFTNNDNYRYRQGAMIEVKKHCAE